MKKVGGFLELFKNLGSSQLMVRQNFVDLVKDKLSYQILLKDVVYKNSCITVNAAPGVRAAILMKKGWFMEELEKVNPGKVKDIR